jgi:hypothetical protein
MSRTAPFHAATAIYSEGDFIYLQLRATKGYTQELSFPATSGGMAALMRVLREREMALATQPHKIAGPSMPIQHVVNSWMRDPNIESKAAAAKARAKSPKEQMNDLAALFDDPNFDF